MTSDEPQIFRDLRRVDPRNAVPDEQGGNAAARRMWLGPEPSKCHVLGCSDLAAGIAYMRWQGADLEVPICGKHQSAINAGATDHLSIGPT